ncbi:MAG: hypothetical protein HYV20_02420 [Gemmatimonadetes bacterium]|nr:hypothetical protein [Gemmatimonadota bacterium]
MHGASPEDRAALLADVLEQKAVVQLVRKQKPNGTWGDNILGVDPVRGKLLDDAGTVSRYRRLIELGVPTSERAFRLTDRLFYRLLSKDDAPELMFEFRKAGKASPELANWVRGAMREAATTALAQAGQLEDPRVRGAAHRIASNVSQFLRSELADKPLIRRGSRTVLHPEAYPPTVFSVAMVALMPNLQRERAGFVERLTAFLGRPAAKREYVVVVGKKAVKPVFQLLGDPIQADSAGHPKDLPLALHWIEVLVRLGALHTYETAQRVLARLLKECDAQGVWAPKSLRSLPRSPSKLADFAFPLEFDGKTPERRQADVTFRLGLIAKLAGWQLEFV